MEWMLTFAFEPFDVSCCLQTFVAFATPVCLALPYKTSLNCLWSQTPCSVATA